MARYEGGKSRRHFTLTDSAYSYLSDMAKAASLSKSETVERIIRSTAYWEARAMLADEPWQYVTDHLAPADHDPHPFWPETDSLQG